MNTDKKSAGWWTRGFRVECRRFERDSYLCSSAFICGSTVLLTDVTRGSDIVHEAKGGRDHCDVVHPAGDIFRHCVAVLAAGEHRTASIAVVGANVRAYALIQKRISPAVVDLTPRRTIDSNLATNAI